MLALLLPEEPFPRCLGFVDVGPIVIGSGVVPSFDVPSRGMVAKLHNDTRSVAAKSLYYDQEVSTDAIAHPVDSLREEARVGER